MHDVNHSHPPVGKLTNAYSERTFPPFSLSRLLKTVFAPKGGERVCILIDLPDTAQMKDFGFLAEPKFTIQRHAYEVFYQGLRAGVLQGKDLGVRLGKPPHGPSLDVPVPA